MSPLRKDEGFALVSAVILMTAMLGLGLGLLTFTDNQQKASAREQWSEEAFNVAEAALNAQVGQLSRVWPTAANYKTVAVSRCTEGLSTSANYCPPSVPLSVGYGKLTHTSCPAGAQTDAWGSPITNQWTTYVRSVVPSSTYFNSKNEEGAVDYAPSSKENPELEDKLWVRAVGVVNCRTVSLATLVSRQLVSVPFPKDVLGGNWFEVTNKGGHGEKGIVNGKGNAAEDGEVGMRCEGREKGNGSGQCEHFENNTKTHKEQFENYKQGPPTSSPVLTEEQLATVKSLAEANGTLRSTALGNCPKSMEELTGDPAYIECGNLQISGNGNANSSTSPGFLAMAEGTLTLKGSGTFYGAIYSRNPANSPEAMVILGGGVTIYGAIEVDGKGGIELGSNSVNLVYEPKAIVELKGSAGATPTRNTFRILPITQ